MTAAASIDFRIRRGPEGSATCQECRAVLLPDAGEVYSLSNHLIDDHGFDGNAIEFEVVSETICPPMTRIRAAGRIA